MTKRRLSCLSSRVVYENRFLRLREDMIRRGTADEPYGIVERADCAIVIPLSEQYSTMLLKQLRYPTLESSWEVPMGGIDDGETAEQAARRELREETGLLPRGLQLVGAFRPLPSLTAQTATVYLATVGEVDLLAAQPEAGVDDIVARKVVSWTTVRRMVRRGMITDGVTLASISLIDSVAVLPRP
jgi:8-oxo-dGTP pyrophosphatase MutT (NUDIX family)